MSSEPGWEAPSSDLGLGKVSLPPAESRAGTPASDSFLSSRTPVGPTSSCSPPLHTPPRTRPLLGCHRVPSGPCYGDQTTACHLAQG